MNTWEILMIFKDVYNLDGNDAYCEVKMTLTTGCPLADMITEQIC